MRNLNLSFKHLHWHPHLGTRLALGFGAVLLGGVALAGVGGVQFQRFKSAFDEVTSHRMPAVLAVAQADHHLQVLRRTQIEVMLEFDPGKRAAKIDEARNALEQLSARVLDMQPKASALPIEHTAWSQLQTQLQAYAAVSAQLPALAANLSKATETRQLVTVDAAQAGQAVEASMNALTRHSMEMARQAAQAGEAIQSGSQRVMVSVAALMVALGALVAWQITRATVGPLRRAIAAAQQIAQGDLSVALPQDRHDEVGELQAALVTMQTALRRIVNDIRDSSDSVNTAAGEIAMGNLDLSRRTETHAASVQETSSSMMQLTDTVKATTQTAMSVQQVVEQASQAADQGHRAFDEVIATMGDIQRSSDKITDIINVIDHIAFQTNILALNAAVEAARAGEQGRGFAVVAAEVRNLAQRSGSAARDIKALITNTVDTVGQGSQRVQRAGSAMGDIQAQVHHVNALVSDILTATQSQRDGIEHAHGAISALDHGMQQNAALVEQASAAAESLRHQARQLTALVATFRLADGGLKRPPASQLESVRTAMVPSILASPGSTLGGA